MAPLDRRPEAAVSVPGAAPSLGRPHPEPWPEDAVESPQSCLWLPRPGTAQQASPQPCGSSHYHGVLDLSPAKGGHSQVSPGWGSRVVRAPWGWLDVSPFPRPIPTLGLCPIA